MQATSHQQDATSQNLSHAMKPGYRREIVRFESIGQPQDIVAPLNSLHTDFSTGILEFTGGEFDVALNGPGFFSVQGPNGPLYTRNGVFQLNGQSQIVTPDGLLVQSATGGPIAVPVDAGRSIEILADGSVVSNGAVVDQIKITAFKDPTELQRAGSTYFQALPDTETTPVTSEVRHGYRELGNTTVVHEMVQMLAGARLFDATQRALRQIGETIALNTRPK
jgi:flagellar basal body rod protein FlgG